MTVQNDHSQLQCSAAKVTPEETLLSGDSKATDRSLHSLSASAVAVEGTWCFKDLGRDKGRTDPDESIKTSMSELLSLDSL